MSRPRGGDDTGEALTPHPSHAVFFYLGACVGISWMAWQARNAGPFAFIAEAAREVQLEMEPPAPVRLGLPASLEAGQAVERTPAQTWWMPSTRGADLERAAAACATERIGGIPVGGFAVVDVDPDGIHVGGRSVLELDAGRLPGVPSASLLVPSLAVAVEEMRALRWTHHLELACAEVDPERVLLVFDAAIPMETREAVERTLCLVGIRADRPLPDRRARRRMDGVRRHEWALEDEVPVAFDPVGTCGMAEAGPWMPMPALPR